MPEYFYQYNFQTENFEDGINNQIPSGDTVASIKSTFCPIIGVDVPATSEEDLDGYLATQSFVRVQPATPPTDQIALGEIQLEAGTGPLSQRVTSTAAKTNLWNLNTQETSGIITPDAANNELTIDTLFNTNTGDRYDFTVNMGVAMPFRSFLVFEMIHNDDGVENIITTLRVDGLIFDSAVSVSMTGSFLVDNATNQSAYINARTIGGSANINYYSGNAILKRF